MEEGIIIPFIVHTGPGDILSSEIIINRKHKGFSFFFTGDQAATLTLELFLFGAFRTGWDSQVFLGDGSAEQWIFDNNKIPDDKAGAGIRARIKMTLTVDTEAGVHLSLHEK